MANISIFELVAREQAAFTDFMAENGYLTKTTFWQDFSIADRFGLGAVKDTYNRAFEGWKHNYKYLTELVMVLNHKIWYWYEKNERLGRLYNDLWQKLDTWCLDNLKDEEKAYYIRTLD